MTPSLLDQLADPEQVDQLDNVVENDDADDDPVYIFFYLELDSVNKMFLLFSVFFICLCINFSNLIFKNYSL